MIRISPVKRALVPINSEAAQRISGSNYDEFQGNEEIWEILQDKPDNILRITMPHCDVPARDGILKEGSPAAFERAAENMAALVRSDFTRTVDHVLWVYEIDAPHRSGVRQIGLGGMLETQQIRTEENPAGSIVRNEGVDEAKVQGRQELIETTRAFIGAVNLAFEDAQGHIASALQAYVDAHPRDYATTDQAGNRHHIWLVREPETQARFIDLFEAEPFAYVADGNHRSLAAFRLGCERFLGVCFPAERLGLAPYHRLVQGPVLLIAALTDCLKPAFEVEALGALDEFQPTHTDEIGLYTQGVWFRLKPTPLAYDPTNAVQTIAADIVQREIFTRVFGIDSDKDPRLTFVGGNRGTAYLKRKVDDGAHTYAISLAPVTMQQFMEVCRQNRFMPRKSTWFSPKVRSGLVIALNGKTF